MSNPKKHLFGDRITEHGLKLTNSSDTVRKDINILVYETDPAIQYLYQQYMDIVSPHVSCIIIDDIERLTKSTDNSIINRFKKKKKSNFDNIIIDIKVGDYDVIRVAKELLQSIPRQKIVFTTTTPPRIIKDEMASQGLPTNVILLQKPFSFSDLLAVISPTKDKFDKLKLTDHVLASYNSLQEELMDVVDFIKKGIELNELSLFLIRNDMDVKKTIYC